MNRNQRGILYGMAIGGSYLRPRNRDRGINVCFLTEHSVAQSEYIKHKRDLMHSICGGKRPEIHYRERHDKRTDKVYKSLSYSRTLLYFNQIRKVLYPEGTKTYTRKMLNYLTPQGLALWYMDDGSIRGYTSKKTGNISSIQMSLATHCSKEEAEIIQTYFKEVWGVDARIHKRKSNGHIHYNICMNTKAAHRYASFIWPYIIPSMEYKMRFLEDFVLHTSAKPLSNGDDMV